MQDVLSAEELSLYTAQKGNRFKSQFRIIENCLEPSVIRVETAFHRVVSSILNRMLILRRLETLQIRL